MTQAKGFKMPVTLVRKIKFIYGPPSLRHRVIPSLMERMTPKDPPHGQISALQSAVLFNCFHCILGTGGRVDATRHLLQPRQMFPVKPD